MKHCPECGCTATQEPGSDDGTVYVICDDYECAYTWLTEGSLPDKEICYRVGERVRYDEDPGVVLARHVSERERSDDYWVRWDSGPTTRVWGSDLCRENDLSMRYDECYLNHMPVGKFCAGSRSWHFERPDGTQFTTCETHSGITYDGLTKVSHRTD
jgi:hypothetical protein